MRTGKRCRPLPFIALMVSLSPFPALYGGEELPEIQQVTTHPALDFSPAVSPDGRWLAFVSERSGNWDVWIKRLPHGTAVRITSHPAEDGQPAWSPDGERLAFVSRRRDAQGDVWIVRVRTNRGGGAAGDPVQITDFLGGDTEPAFSPDGNSLVFVSERDGAPNLYVQDLRTNRVRALTTDGGEYPAWSPDGKAILFTSYREDPGGDVYIVDSDAGVPEGERARPRRITGGISIDGQGAWSPDGRSIVFQRIDRDTNGDGRVNLHDAGSLWRGSADIEASSSPDSFVQITTELYDDSEPFWGPDDRVYFASRRGGGSDVWMLPAGGILPAKSSASEQYIAVLERFGESVTQEALYQALLGYRRVRTSFPGKSVWAARSLLHEGEVYLILQDGDRAGEALRTVVDEYAEWPSEVARAKLKLVSIAGQSIDERIDLCQEVVNSTFTAPSVRAEAWILLGDLYSERGEGGAALAAYGRVLDYAPSFRNLRAQAQLKIGDLLLSEGQEETARQSYLLVLREFNDVPLWRERAGNRMLDLVRGTLGARVRGYQQIIQDAADLPNLVAKAQISVGRILMEEGLLEQAVRELEAVETLVPDLEWAHAESRILRAELFGKMGDELKGILLLEGVMASYETLEGGRYAGTAERVLFHLLYDSAERLKSFGDFSLAETRYRRALRLRPKDVDVHRGLIEASYRAGNIEAVIQEYEARVEARPQDPVLLYALGLAVSYFGETDAVQLKRSNAYLMRAMDTDYRLIYPYRTLSYNYELLEQLAEQEAAREAGFLEKAGRAVLAPIRWLVGLVPLGRDEKKEQYYEKAIEALTTALELNDENADPRMEAQLAQNLANNFYHLGEYGYRNAYTYYRLRLSRDSTFAQPLERAVFYERAGRCGAVLRIPGKPADYLNEAIRRYAELGREDASVRSMRLLAFYHHLMGDYEAAISVYERTVAMSEKKGGLMEAELDNRNIAYNYFLMGETADALVYALRAEDILDGMRIPIRPSRKNKLRLEVFGFSIPIWGMEEIGGASAEGFTPSDELALVYSLIGRCHESLKNTSQAVSYEEKRLEIFRRQKDHLAERITLNRLGRLHYKQSDFENAWDYFQLSYQENRRHRDDRGRWVTAVNLGNVATVQLSGPGGDIHLDEAMISLRRELDRMTRDDPAADPHGRLVLLNSLGTLQTLRVGRESSLPAEENPVERSLGALSLLQEARELFEQGLSIARQERWKREEGICLKNLAEVHRLLREDGAAYMVLMESFRILEAEGEEDLLWRVQFGMAGLASRYKSSAGGVGTDTTALDIFREAMTRLESLPEREEGSEERISDRRERWDLYTNAAYEAASLGRARESLSFAERGRRKQAADLLARRPPELKRERHKVAWGNLRYLRRRMHEVQKEIRISGLEGESSGRATLEDRLSTLRSEYDDVMEGLQEEDGCLAYLAGAGEVSVEPVRRILARYGCAVSFLVHPEALMIWVVDARGVRMETVRVEREALAAYTEAWLHGLLTDSTNVEARTRLLEVLIEPIADAWDNPFVLVIPDGFLWGIPFETLLDGTVYGEGRASMAYAPSLAAYRLAWERRKMNYRDVLVVGEDADAVIARAVEAGARTEKVIPDAQATESRFIEYAPAADLIHMRRWTMPREHDPLASAVVLRSDGKRDGYLSAYELFSEDYRASLVCLPPERGRRFGEHASMLAFYHGLLYAGVPSLLYQAWPMSPEAENRFFGSFYRYLAESNVADAVVQARADLQDSKTGARDRAALRVLGFQGLDERQRLEFARSYLTESVMRGRALERREDYAEAAETFERSLDMAEALGDSSLVGRVYDEIRRVSVKGGMWEKAADAQKQLQTVQAVGREETIRGLNRLVAYYAQNNQFDAAAEMKIASLRLVEEEGTPSQTAAGYEELAFLYAEGRDFEEADARVDDALALYERAGDVPGQGRAMLMKGRFLLESDDYWNARQALSEGLHLLETIPETAIHPDPTAQRASGYQLLGLAEEKLAHYKEALTNQERAVALFERLGRADGIAQGHQYLANVYWAMGNYRSALGSQQKAMESFEALGNAKLLTMSYSTEGLIHLSLGDLTKAYRSEERALGLAEENAFLADQATILKNIGLIAFREEDFPRADDAFRRAVRIDSSLGFLQGLSFDYRNLGSVLLAQDRYEEALSYLRRAKRMSEDIGHARNTAECLYRLGQTYDGMGARGSAFAVLDSALAMTSLYGMPELEWRVLRQRAWVFRNSRQAQEAYRDFERAIRVVEGMRADLRVESYQQGFLDDKMDLYFDVVDHLLGTGRSKEAFDFVERARSRSFIDLLQNQRLALKGDQEAFIGREQEAKRLVEEAQERVLQYRKRGDSGEEEGKERKNWEGELQRRRDAYRELLVEMNASNPELASFVSVDPWGSKRIQAMIPDSTVLLEYFMMNDRLFCWAVENDRFVARTTEVPTAMVESRVRVLLETIQAHLSTRREAEDLYDWLIAPVEREIRDANQIVIVPHGFLHYLPFALLEDGEGNHLIDRFSLSVIPSATVLGYCMEKGETFLPRRQEPSVLALSNPDLGDPAFDLPFAQKEVQSLRRTYENVSAYFGVQATEGMARKEAGSYDLVHFACHGVYEPDHPLFSSLLLSPEGEEDGRLEAHEIFGLDLECDLVTLSACETGLAQITSGDEIIGLARGFIFAGAPSIVTSLWKVDDLATAVLVKRFYRYLKEGFSKAEALRRSQLVVKNSVNRHPSAWAAFTLTGDFR